MITFSIIIIFFAILDRFFKYLAANHYFDAPISIISDILKFKFHGNYNIAFSLPISGLWLNIAIILIILGLIGCLARLLAKKQSCQDKTIFLLLIILGAMSNLLDRLQYGYVIDYLDLKYWTIFNIADMMIVAGVALSIGIITELKKEGK